MTLLALVALSLAAPAAPAMPPATVDLSIPAGESELPVHVEKGRWIAPVAPIPAPVRQDTTGTLAGTVVSAADGRALPGAVVGVQGAPLGAISDSAGAFRIAGVPGGRVTVEVSYVGFERNRLDLDVAPGAVNRVVFLLSPTAIRLAELRVEVERGLDPRERAFERRRRHGAGHFVTYEQIRERAPRYASDILRGLPGVRVGPVTFGVAQVTMARGARSCSPALILDGVYMPGMMVDEIPVHDVEMVEVYVGPSQIPNEFASLRREGCGVLVLWTHAGGRPR